MTLSHPGNIHCSFDALNVIVWAELIESKTFCFHPQKLFVFLWSESMTSKGLHTSCFSLLSDRKTDNKNPIFVVQKKCQRVQNQILEV